MILLLIAIVVSVVSIILMPKRLSLLELYTTSYFATFLAALADIYLDVKLDLYGFFEKGVNWGYLPIFVIIYPASSVLFLNFFPYQKSRMKKVNYIIGVSILATLLEYIALHTDLFYHNGWKLWYSAICYPILFTCLYFNRLLINKLAKMYSQKGT